MQAKEAFLTWSILVKELDILELNMRFHNISEVLKQLKSLVAGFEPDIRSWK